MIRTGSEYRDSLRGGREIFVGGERVADVTAHPAFRPLVDIRARIHDMQHDPATRDLLTWAEGGERFPIGARLPYSQADWWAKRRATDTVLDAVGGVVSRVGDDTVGEMWSLHDAAEVLNAIDPRFAGNIRAHVDRVTRSDLFQVTANTDLKGDRSLTPREQDPDALLRVVRETDAGIVVRGAKVMTAAAYADQAFVKPAIANWGGEESSDYAVGFICDLDAAGLKFICRAGTADRLPPEDHPLSARFDEVDSLVVFDDVLVPWDNVLFHRHSRSAMLMHAVLHRYTAFAFVQRNLRLADMLIGAALLSVRSTGLDRQQGVQEKLAKLACWREGINAHLTAAVALAEKSPAGLMMPNQSLLYAGRVLAGSQMHEMMNVARDLCGGQVCVTPDAASFAAPETGPWLEKYYAVGEDWIAEDRRRLLAFAHDLLNSDHAGRMLSFQMFGQAPAHAHLAALYRSFDWDGPAALVRDAAGLSDRATADTAPRDGEISRWFARELPKSDPPRAAAGLS